jgi:hypothetical protein
MENKKILNTVRGEGANIIERAGRITVQQCRERRAANRVSYCIYTPPYDPADYVEPGKRKKRTILWP